MELKYRQTQYEYILIKLNFQKKFHKFDTNRKLWKLIFPSLCRDVLELIIRSL